MNLQDLTEGMLQTEADKRTHQTFLRAFRILRANAMRSARGTSGDIRALGVRAARRANVQLVRLLRGAKFSALSYRNEP